MSNEILQYQLLMATVLGALLQAIFSAWMVTIIQATRYKSLAHASLQWLIVLMITTLIGISNGEANLQCVIIKESKIPPLVNNILLTKKFLTSM